MVDAKTQWTARGALGVAGILLGAVWMAFDSREKIPGDAASPKGVYEGYDEALAATHRGGRPTRLRRS